MSKSAAETMVRGLVDDNQCPSPSLLVEVLEEIDRRQVTRSQLGSLLTALVMRLQAHR